MASPALTPMFEFIGLEVPMSASGTATRLGRRADFRRSLIKEGTLGLQGERECFCWMEAESPARLRPSDLQNPEDFHRRLAQWLMEQR